MTALLARSAPAATDPKHASSSTYESVQDYYGKVLADSKDLKTSACSGSKPALPVLEALKLVPEEVLARFYGCGAPLPLGIDGLTVLDLGSGSGRDSYVCAQLVGEHGRVIGIDFTKELIQVNVLLSHAWIIYTCNDSRYEATRWCENS